MCVWYGACACVLFFCFTPAWVSSFFVYICLGNSFFSFSFYFTALHPACTCISTQQLVRMFIGRDWDKSCSSGIWVGKNADSTIGNEMVNEWTDSGKWDGRKSVKVGNGMGSEWADSGTGSGTGTVYLAVGRETREHKSVTGEVGKQRSGKEIS